MLRLRCFERRDAFPGRSFEPLVERIAVVGDELDTVARASNVTSRLEASNHL